MGRADGFSALQHRSRRLPRENNSCKSVFKKSSTRSENLNKKKSKGKSIS